MEEVMAFIIVIIVIITTSSITYTYFGRFAIATIGAKINKPIIIKESLIKFIKCPLDSVCF